MNRRQSQAVTSTTYPPILPGSLQKHIAGAIEAAGGWIGFDRFMEMALYTPGWGYYANGSRKFGLMPQSGSDFATAPEMSPHFGRALARQLGQALDVTGTDEVWEFGAGTGALAGQLLQALEGRVTRYNIVDLSGSLRERQGERLAAFGDKVHWVSELPDQIRGVVVGNEVLDAMPVKMLARIAGRWHERGVSMAPTLVASRTALPPEGGCVSLGAARRETHEGAFVYADQATDLRPPVDIEGPHDYVTEIHPQAEGFIRTLADRLVAGAAFLIDYGFPEQEFYHPQRSMGTLMCHRLHVADTNPLVDVGDKDITAHVNFTGIALAAQDAGMQVLGYTSQGRFLLNCGLLDGLQDVSLPERVMVQKLINEHEMGELFKVVALGAKNSTEWNPVGFGQGDRTHKL